MSFLKALPSRADRINWLVLILSLSICLLLAAIMGAIGSERSADPLIRRSSTFFADDSGMLAAYLIAAELLPSAERFQRPFSTLGLLDTKKRFSTLVLAGPMRHLSRGSAQALDEWISRGGQLILACDRDWPIGTGMKSLSEVLRDEAQKASQELEEAPPQTVPSSGTEKDSPKQGGYLKRHGVSLNRKALSLETAAQTLPADPSQQDVLRLKGWMDAQGLQPLVSSEGRVLAGALPLGEGRLVVIPDRLAFSNQRLRESSNAVWLIRTISAWQNGQAAFDEFHHGFGVRRSYADMLSSFAATPWGWVCLQASLAGLVYLLIYRRRFGRLQEAAQADRRSPLQVVQARGQLLAAAQARPLAVEWIHRSLNLRISRGLGYPVDLDDEATRKRLSKGASNSARRLREYLKCYRRLRSGQSLTDADLVELGRSAGRLAREFQAGA